MEVLTGNLVAARETLAEVERLARRLDSPFTLATVLNIQASLAKLAGEDDDALERLIEAAGLAGEAGISWTQVYTVPALADLAGRGGQPELAVRLYAAAATLAEATGWPCRSRPMSSGAWPASPGSRPGRPGDVHASLGGRTRTAPRRTGRAGRHSAGRVPSR